MKDLKHIQKFNEHQENLNISDVMNSILNDLQNELDMYKTPLGYQDEEYYIKCDAKVDAYEDAINIVKKYCS
jgi:hypothetical protein